jgi:ABC-type dipeptide/oligopeptide/nickel transport system permease subunit
MSATANTAEGLVPEVKSAPTTSNSLWKDAWTRLFNNKIAVISLITILVYSLIAILAALGVIGHGYDIHDSTKAFLGPSLEHWAGTDFFGRDVWGRGLHATKTALTVGLFSSAIALVIGVTLGALAGYFGGWVDDIIIWLYTTLDSIPYILLMAAFQIALGQGLSNLFIALGLTTWVTLCRLIRGEFLKQKEKEYVEAARSLGASHSRRIFLHILPNVMHLGLIQFGLIFVTAIKAEVILSFLGLGVEVGTPSWGIMITDSKQEITQGHWQNLTTATIMMFGLILAVNLFNDALRDALDPKLKNK